MKLVSLVSIFFTIFILSGCNGANPNVYHDDYSNQKIFIRTIFVKNQSQAKAIIQELNNANNKLDKFIELQKQYSMPINGQPTSNNAFWTDAISYPAWKGNKVFKLKEGDYLKEPLIGTIANEIVFLEKRITKEQFKQLQTDYNKKQLERIASYEVNYLKEHNKLVKELPKKFETYIQPYNKKESCKVWMQYIKKNIYFEEDSYKIAWDGKCKNGYASGLGREIESADMMNKWGIAIYKKGKPIYYVTKDNLSDVLFEGIQDVRNDDSIGVTTIIKETNNDIDIQVVSSVYDGKNHVSYKESTSPFWNGTYFYSKEYLNFRYFYQDNTRNDINRIAFGFGIQNNDGINNGWSIDKLKNSNSIRTGEYILGKGKQFKLPQSYIDKANNIISEIKKNSQKAYQAQEQAQQVKKQYLKRICKKSIKVSWMDNDDYKEICNPKREIALMKKTNAKLQKISEEKIAILEKQKYKEQQQKEEQHRQKMLNLERARLAEIQRHNARVEQQEDSRQFQQSLDSLNKQIRDMTPKTYNVNVFHY